MACEEEIKCGQESSDWHWNRDGGEQQEIVVLFNWPCRVSNEKYQICGRKYKNASPAFMKLILPNHVQRRLQVTREMLRFARSVLVSSYIQPFQFLLSEACCANCFKMLHCSNWDVQLYPYLNISTEWLFRIPQRIWRETKMQPSTARSGHHISCILFSLHFLCDI